ncbi:traB domain-containing protein isoform X1 [Vigna radiata var. radiata]|uniref:TraB domain-containing protein isoform X1 n=1 Tax=Vigna radiata var. radiata TaxID=3916 RepID=A0A3Q0ER67_VIGRR|nr:traB domain-containing protein isoform X1 [Vigna radiata var. radiata]
MFQRLIGHLVIRTRTLNQLARVTPFIHRHKSLLAAPFSCSQTLSSLQFSTDTSAVTHHPVRLPEDLSKNLIVLSCESSAEGGVCHVYLVGVSHGSKESYRRVQATVKFLKPEAVFLELCQSRASYLTRKNYKIHVPTQKEMVTRLRKKENIFSVFIGWFQAKTADDPHEDEFRVAYEEAIKYGGKVIFGDRPGKITLRRFWSKTPLWHKTI